MSVSDPSLSSFDFDHDFFFSCIDKFGSVTLKKSQMEDCYCFKFFMTIKLNVNNPSFESWFSAHANLYLSSRNVISGSSSIVVNAGKRFWKLLVGLVP